MNYNITHAPTGAAIHCPVLSRNSFRQLKRKASLLFLGCVFLFLGCTPYSSLPESKAEPAPVAPAVQAIATIPGQPAKPVSSAKDLAAQALLELQSLTNRQNALTARLWSSVNSEYIPQAESNDAILANNFELGQPFIVGDKGYAQASLSFVEGGRGAAYVNDIFEQFNDGKNLRHVGAFKRLITWLVKGDPDATLPAQLAVAWSGIDVSAATSAIEKTGIKLARETCDFLVDSKATCVDRAQLLVLSNAVKPDAALEERIRRYIRAGKPVLYTYLYPADPEANNQILAGMGLHLESTGVNDKASAGRTEAETIARNNQFRQLSVIVNAMASESYALNYDWSLCEENDCSKVTALKTELIEPLNILRNQLNEYNRRGSNVFAAANNNFLRLMVQWADAKRPEIRYPLDKKRNAAGFEKALIADALVAYVRDNAPAQADLGTFAGVNSANLPVSGSDEIISIKLPAANGFTQIGTYAVPGKTLTLELLDITATSNTSNAIGARKDGETSLALRLNTQSTGSTRLWQTENNISRYDRPQFLSSENIALTANQPLQITSPYGGTMQLVFKGASAGQTVRLRLRGVAKHPFLDLSGGMVDTSAFLEAINKKQYDWAEIKMGKVEVHTRTDKLQQALADPVYAYDMNKYVNELSGLLFDDLYQLAGFALPHTTTTSHVKTMCAKLGWDCNSASLHQSPGVQHINSDTYANCGSGCAGNPYDQDWPLNPRNWGESHEVGHNNQPDLLLVYEDRSSEVSNNIFPLHKTWRMRKELNDNRDDDTVNYRSAFNMLKAAKIENNPVAGAYQRIWSSSAYAAQNAERLAFYMQWIHYWAERNSDEATGWDIYTLLYMHQRQFERGDWASFKNKLGYSQYATRPDIKGNDNFLIALSWITQRDQRPSFDLWGIRYSTLAARQVASYGFAREAAFFFANTTVNNHATVRRVDMSVLKPVWPF